MRLAVFGSFSDQHLQNPMAVLVLSRLHLEQWLFGPDLLRSEVEPDEEKDAKNYTGAQGSIKDAFEKVALHNSRGTLLISHELSILFFRVGANTEVPHPRTRSPIRRLVQRLIGVDFQ